MNVDWQVRLPIAGPSLGPADRSRPQHKTAAPSQRARRDRFDYWLIFAMTLPILASLGLIQRCNPLFWLSHRAPGRSLWAESKSGAHHYATMAFQG